jgi:hypothetical protein
MTFASSSPLSPAIQSGRHAEDSESRAIPGRYALWPDRRPQSAWAILFYNRNFPPRAVLLSPRSHQFAPTGCDVSLSPCEIDSIMLIFARLVVISLLALVGLAVSTAAQSSAAQKVMSSFLEELLHEFRVDEITSDDGEERVIARGSMVQPNGLVQMGVLVDCDASIGSMIIRNQATATQDLYPVDRAFCEALAEGLRERDHSPGR